MKLGAMATVVSTVSAMAVGGQAEAQAVQWKSGPGANGHWYQVVSAQTIGNSQEAALQLAQQFGGGLASFETLGEWNFVSATVVALDTSGPNPQTMYLGGRLVGNEWQWIDGRPWPANAPWFTPGSGPGECPGVAAPNGDGAALQSFCNGRYWDDRPVLGGGAINKALIEWSADCNNDNVVDYGQCRDGSLPDYNGNNIPDCCEQGTPCVLGNYPVEWRVADGGDGHWHRMAGSEGGSGISYYRLQASGIGGELGSANSAPESAQFVRLLRGSGDSYVLGGFQAAGASEPNGGWAWFDGSEWAFTNWLPNEPSDSGGIEDYLAANPDGRWNDVAASVNLPRFVIEWSADCNNDGVVDYGQILRGQLADVDANGVPDICEPYAVPREYPTIQAAIDAVPTGVFGWVSVAAGTYNESFSLNGKNVIVRGAPNNATILDGTGLATSLARFTGNEPATAGVENLVFRNGTAGSRLFPKATFTVGGAVYGLNSAAFIRNCRFEQNEADFGGGVYLFRCDAAVEGCVFAGNEALTDGGGFFAYECSGSVRATDFTANICGASGSGNGGAFKTVGARAAGGVFLLEDCSLTANISGVDGAAVHHFENSSIGIAGGLRIVDCQITGNTSVVGAGGVRNDGPQSALALAGTTNVCTNLRSNISGPYLIEGLVTVCDCNADITGDGLVNGGDLGVLLSAWGVAPPSGDGDVNHDGLVNGSDLSMVLSSWGACH